MQEISIRVMNMVRRTLLENPEVSDRTLYSAAIALDPSIEGLTFQRFQARYPRRVRRMEIGERRGRAPGAAARGELAIGERPYVYAPGSSTLTPEEAVAVRADAENSVEERSTPTRGVRRRSRPAEGGQEGGAASGRPGPPATLFTGSETESSPAGAEPAERDVSPWPLRFQPRAVPRDVPARARRRTRRERPDAEASAPVSAAVDREDRSERQRTETRRILFTWAQDLVTAESRGDLVRVLAEAEAHVTAIAEVWSGRAAAPHVDGGGPASDAGGSRVAGAAVTPEAGPAMKRPLIPLRKHIREHRPAELDALVRWIVSRGEFVTDDEIVTAVFAELNFRRLGRRIRAVIENSLKRVRAQG